MWDFATLLLMYLSGTACLCLCLQLPDMKAREAAISGAGLLSPAV